MGGHCEPRWQRGDRGAGLARRPGGDAGSGPAAGRTARLPGLDCLQDLPPTPSEQVSGGLGWSRGGSLQRRGEGVAVLPLPAGAMRTVLQRAIDGEKCQAPFY